MTLLQATLADGLAALTPTGDASVAITRIADAWEAYFEAATVGPTQVATGTLAGAKAALVGGLAGLNAPGGGATALQTGIVAWWAAVAASAAVIWAGNAPPVLSATVPPSLGTIGVALSAVFASNQTNKLSLRDAADAIAAVLHPLQLGAVAAIGPPASTLPIL